MEVDRETVTERGLAVAFIERMQDRMAERLVPFRFGTALFHDRLPRSWSLNLLRVQGDDAELSAQSLLAEADRIQGGAGLSHRKIEVNNEPVGRRLEPSFRDRGWKVERSLVMTHRGETAHASAAGSVIEVDAEALLPKWELGIRAEKWGNDDETVRQLLEAQLLRQRAVLVRYFAANVDGRAVSECQLFSDGRTAQVESVHAVEAYRGRGLAGAVVARAVAEAHAASHEVVFLLADENDWPKELYRKLGFAEVGRVWDFARTAVRS